MEGRPFSEVIECDTGRRRNSNKAVD